MSRPEPLAGERQSNESNKAVQAKNDWLRMGPGRSLTELWRKYREMPRNAAPTQSLYTIGAWSKHFGWELCAAQYDAEQERIKNERAAEIMNTGLALAYERVSKLKRLADFLEGEMYEIGKDVEGKDVHHNIWMPDVKQVGSGENAERVDIERYNSAIVGDYRGVLDDLAKETGGRVQKQDHTGSLNVSQVKVYIPENNRGDNG